MAETLREMMARMDQRQEDMHGDIKEVKNSLYGNGGDGLKIKVDRNTQWRKGWRRHIPTGIAFLLLLATVIGIIVAYTKESP